MPTDPAGIYTLPPSYYVENGDLLTPNQHNPPFEDIETALSERLMRDGRLSMTGNLVMNGNKVTGLGAATGNNDAVPLGQMNTGLAGKADASRQITAGAGLAGGGDLSADRSLALTGQALALHNLGTNGLVARTAAGAVAGRTLTGGSGIDVTNGNGVSGNPTAAVDSTVVRTTGNQSIAGTKNFTGALQVGGNPVAGVYTGSDIGAYAFPLGHMVLASNLVGARNNGVTPRLSATTNFEYVAGGSGIPLAGTWRARGGAVGGPGMAQRIA